MTFPSSRPRALAFAAAVTLATVAGPARADVTAEQRAAAQVLFDEGRRLMSEKRWADACPKLEESQRIDPGLGTLLNLAECQAQSGKTASAWANFLEATYQAKSRNDAKREATARAKAAALEARLSKLTVNAPAGVEVKRDGVAMSSSTLGTALPVDPGEHVITATAPGKAPWSTKIVVKDNADRITVGIPTLDPEGSTKPPPPPVVTQKEPAPPPVMLPPPNAPPPPLAPLPDDGHSRRIGGLVAMGVGVGGLVVGGVFTALAKIQYDKSLDNCLPQQPDQCFPDGVAQRDKARTSGNIATVAVISGGIVAAGGLGLLISGILAKPASPGVAAVDAAIDPRGGGFLNVTGRF